ncbi:RT_Bac_retron_II domain containing protein [Candidatus Nanopelagicaceae bacterium]
MSSMEEMRQRVAEIGKDAAILEQMIQLGFITSEDLSSGKLNESQVQEVLAELKPTVQELYSVQSRLSTMSNIEALVKEIRKERIAEVKARREERKIAKERDRAIRHEKWEVRKRTEAPFLGVGVSSRLQFEGGDFEKLKSHRLPLVETLLQLASAMELTTDDLVWLCYERAASDTDHYSRFEIPKRSGGKRLISSPKPKMRIAQSWINENILKALIPSQYCFAFRPKLSILDNAQQHVNKPLILKLDVQDFFPSITFVRVRGYFEYLGYNPGIATVLALLCTDSPRVRVTVRGKRQIVAIGPRSLPQGACTSPALANLIASRLDSRISAYVAKLKGSWTYTRYADDLTFSTSEVDAPLGQIISAVSKISADENFKIKNTKTRIMRSPKRQTVTGLVVGEDVRIPKATIKKMRALFHNIDTKGKEVVSEELGKEAVNVARGYWAYLHMVSPTTANKYLKKYRWLVR